MQKALTHETHRYVYVSGVRKCYFSRKPWVRTKWMFFYLQNGSRYLKYFK